MNNIERVPPPSMVMMCLAACFLDLHFDRQRPCAHWRKLGPNSPSALCSQRTFGVLVPQKGRLHRDNCASGVPSLYCEYMYVLWQPYSAVGVLMAAQERARSDGTVTTAMGGLRADMLHVRERCATVAAWMAAVV